MTEKKKMADLTKGQWQTALAPFAAMLAGLEASIRNMDGDDLSELHDAIKYPTQTNCWCFTYRAAKHIEEIVDEEMHQRKLIHRESAP